MEATCKLVNHLLVISLLRIVQVVKNYMNHLVQIDLFCFCLRSFQTLMVLEDYLVLVKLCNALIIISIFMVTMNLNRVCLPEQFELLWYLHILKKIAVCFYIGTILQKACTAFFLLITKFLLHLVDGIQSLPLMIRGEIPAAVITFCTVKKLTYL